MSKHTPGPWKIAGQGESGTQQLPIYGGGNIIAAIRDQGSLADARLIAAAPEMLKAAKDFLRDMDDMDVACCQCEHMQLDEDESCAFCTLEALIAKIDGE